jgi:hypothetical protein
MPEFIGIDVEELQLLNELPKLRLLLLTCTDEEVSCFLSLEFSQ